MKEKEQKMQGNYYKCTGVKRHKGCHKKTVRKADIEEIVLNDVMDKMFKEDLINDIADSVMRLQEKENTTIPLMQKQLAEIHQSINNLVKATDYDEKHPDAEKAVTHTLMVTAFLYLLISCASLYTFSIPKRIISALVIPNKVQHSSSRFISVSVILKRYPDVFGSSVGLPIFAIVSQP